VRGEKRAGIAGISHESNSFSRSPATLEGLTAAVETPLQHTLVLTSLPMSPVSLEQVRSAGVKPERFRVIVAKGVVAPHGAYEPIAARVLLVNTPGATAADPGLFEYVHRRKPLYPFEPDATYP
jgi:microcystin degradation protein MlrC